jgi:hypothetical protein
VITTVARLAPAQLRCAGSVRDSSDEAVARLRIVLRATGSGVRIAAEQQMGAARTGD